MTLKKVIEILHILKEFTDENSEVSIAVGGVEFDIDFISHSLSDQNGSPCPGNVLVYGKTETVRRDRYNHLSNRQQSETGIRLLSYIQSNLCKKGELNQTLPETQSHPQQKTLHP